MRESGTCPLRRMVLGRCRITGRPVVIISKTGSTRPELSYYMSQAYRETIKDTNKAARKFLKLSDEQVSADVREFAITGAKDSDTPASCN